MGKLRHVSFLAGVVLILLTVGAVIVLVRSNQQSQSASSSDMKAPKAGSVIESTDLSVVQGTVQDIQGNQLSIVESSGKTQKYTVSSDVSITRLTQPMNLYPVPFGDKQLSVLPTNPDSELTLKDIKQGEKVALNVLTEKGTTTVTIIVIGNVNIEASSEAKNN